VRSRKFAIARTAAELGIGIFKPLTDGERYDLILDLRPRLVRIQCKWARLRNDVVFIPCYSNRRAAGGQRRRAYTAREADAIVAYCANIDRCFFVPADRFAGRSQLMLRLAPSRNNQRLHVNWADDFDLRATLIALAGP
jgi:hypothetical protein